MSVTVRRVEHDAHLYGEVWADLYDDVFGNREDVEVVADAIEQLGGRGPVLEFGIGTGRIAFPVASRGIEVHGIDISARMLEKLKEKSDAAKIEAIQGDFTQVRLDRRFSLVLSAFSVMFMLASQDEQVRCFANAARHLESGGVFVVEAFVPDPGRWTQRQNLTVVRVERDFVDLNAGKLDPVRQEIVYARIFLRDSGVEVLPSRLRYAWPAELDLMAQLAGMRLRERWGGWRGEAFCADSPVHVSIYELDRSAPVAATI